jgi:hypothetical protein
MPGQAFSGVPVGAPVMSKSRLCHRVKLREPIFSILNSQFSISDEHLLLVPCLFLTLMFGPAGWLLYMGVRQWRASLAHARN